MTDTQPFMDEVARLIGYVTLGTAFAAFVMLAAFIVGDAIQCGRFAFRIWRAASDEDVVTARWLLRVWLRYWIGIDRRPAYLVLNSNDETIYWPGKEGSRRYKG